MNLKIFNAALLAGWFLLTIGAIALNPAAGLLIAGVAVIALTLFVSWRFGVYSDEKPKEVKRPDAAAGEGR
jgi:hypothetical protein